MLKSLRSCLPHLFVLLALGVAASAQNESRPRNVAAVNSTVVIAHRGGAEESTENTIEAFQRAIRVGAHGIETDLRLARDGTVVLYHDERYGRVEGLAAVQRTRLVSEMSYAELAAGTLIPVGEDTGGRRVPTLDDLLREVRAGVLNLEIKRGAKLDELVSKTIAALRGFSGLERVVLEPPDLKTAEKLREELGTNLKLHINPDVEPGVPFVVAVERVLKFKPHSISVSYKKVSIELIERAHRAGVEVWVWTVNTPELAQAMAALGADAIKTDRPKAFVELLRNSRRR